MASPTIKSRLTILKQDDNPLPFVIANPYPADPLPRMAELISDRSEYLLCPLNDLTEGQGKGFAANPNAHYADIVVVRVDGGIYAYRNRCPHTGAPMEWEPDRFLDYTGTLIQCGIHGALFRINDGYCIAGPCVRQSLQRIAVTEWDGWLMALEPLERARD